MKGYLILIGVGLFNSIHALLHLIQFIQSLMILSLSTSHRESEGIVQEVLHNPFFNMVVGLIGVVSLVVGIRDFIHHKKCKSV